MPDDLQPDLSSRIAVLEERTRPKERTVLDRIKDWSGVLTFVIAVLYTYPLGVWDRFVVTAEQQKTKEINDLRSTVLKLSELDSEATRTLPSIADVQQQVLYGQITNSRKNSLLIPELPLVRKHYSALSAAELELLGYQLNFLGDQGDLVQQVLESASTKMIAANNNIGAADTYRVQAALYAPNGSVSIPRQSRGL